MLCTLETIKFVLPATILMLLEEFCLQEWSRNQHRFATLPFSDDTGTTLRTTMSRGRVIITLIGMCVLTDSIWFSTILTVIRLTLLILVKFYLQ